MMSFIRSRQAKQALVAAAVVTTLLTVAGCGQKQQAQTAQTAVVRSMQVIKRDTPIVYEYTGFVEATKNMELKAQVTGRITAKYFKGGDTVTAGQPLYEIDARTYQANLLSAKANYNMAAADAERYTTLYNQNAISKQTLDNALTLRDQAKAALLNAEVNMNETTVVAPFTGRIDTTCLEVGNYVTQGQNVLATISNTDPVFVKFSIAEPEYLRLSKNTAGGALDNLVAVLSDGTTYEHKGKVAEVNKGLSDGTGSLTVKAMFPNPDRRLLPGMFAHVKCDSGIAKDAMLIPKRALVEMLYKKFVYVIGADKKVKMVEITTGQPVGRLLMVTSGLKGEETIVVEGTAKLRNDVVVKAETMKEEDLDNLEKSASAVK